MKTLEQQTHHVCRRLPLADWMLQLRRSEKQRKVAAFIVPLTMMADRVCLQGPVTPL